VVDDGVDRDDRCVQSLGWTVVDDGVDRDDRCVQTRVNKSINRLSLGRHDMTP